MADKALLLGINEYKSVNPLRGCLNDVENMGRLLTGVFGFDAKNVISLTNDDVVKDAVQMQMRWLFEKSHAGDRVVLHFSGHGSTVPDPEKDGLAELICLYDMNFDDPATYFLNHELRRWTETLPTGVQLTIVLDCCHSGEGTRLVMASLPGSPFESILARVDAAATMRRAVGTKTSSARALETAAAALDPRHDDVVLVRYVDPPSSIRQLNARRSTTAARDLVTANLNHVLLAACRKDQTAADAVIEGRPNGAFTYHLCKALRQGGAAVERKALIAGLETALKTSHFEQAPQLEADSGEGPLFIPTSGGVAVATLTGNGASRPNPLTSPTGAILSVDQLSAVFQLIGRLNPQVQGEAVKLLREALASPAATGAAARASDGRDLVYVHGICKHEAGYSNGWWNSLHPFTDVFGEGTLGDTRHEVLWSDLVNEREVRRRATPAAGGEQQRAAVEIREALRDRLDRHTIDAGPRSVVVGPARENSDPRALINIPGLDCVDDFTIYLVNDVVRGLIIARFTDLVGGLLANSAQVDVVSHSWGTVVAYEGLRAIEDEGRIASGVRNWFTVGAALSIGPVKSRLKPANRDGRKPALVDRWINLNAHGDVVGGPLQGRPYLVDDDFPNLDPTGCGAFLGLINPVCAHGSYFVQQNLAVNRDIFAAFVDRL